jgi:hypothetical protein
VKIFISSVIQGLTAERSAAREAIEELDHDPVMAEDFGAQPRSPQVACLSELRQCGAVVLLAGASYGAKQASGLSATHEEYREARERLPIFAFVQERVTREPEQAEFVRELESWHGGVFRDSFASPNEIRGKVVSATHRWEVANASRPLNATELLQRALTALGTDHDRGRTGNAYLAMVFAGGPLQAILRPSEIESEALISDLKQSALFGPSKVLSTERGTHHSIDDGNLVIEQDGGGSITLDPQGTILLRLPLQAARDDLAIIQEHVEQMMLQSFKYATCVLDKIDFSNRITHVVPAVRLVAADYLGWRTRAEHDRSSRSFSIGGSGERQPCHLSPPERPRAALKTGAQSLAEDLIVLLRRQAK